jgi:tetratricopeptide (TPR) repeat protein
MRPWISTVLFFLIYYLDSPNFGTVRSSHSFDPTLQPSQKAVYHYIRGKLLNVLPDHNRQAEADLMKACKLDPANTDSWNNLGECFWKGGDLASAKMCFEQSLCALKNVPGLLHMAMAERSERNANFHVQIEKSIALCKEAIDLKMDDHAAWCMYFSL